MSVLKSIFRPVRQLHDILMLHLRTSRWVTRIYFGLDLPNDAHDQLWDYTTIVLCKAIRHYLQDGLHVWDLGCGPAAILAAYASRLASVEILSTDIEENIVLTAIKTVAQAQLHVTVSKADLCNGINECFDLVFFNAPYLPMNKTNLLPTTRPTKGSDAETYLRRFSGGVDGVTTILRFLEEIPSRLYDDGKILLGFNAYYISESKIRKLVHEKGFKSINRISVWWNPSLVLVIVKDYV